MAWNELDFFSTDYIWDKRHDWLFLDVFDHFFSIHSQQRILKKERDTEKKRKTNEYYLNFDWRLKSDEKIAPYNYNMKS